MMLAGILALPAVADSGQAAFDRRDYQSALALWQIGAASGSADAEFGLGLIHDLGLGQAADPAEALRWYLRAAARGHGDAQFNAAVMLDSGTGVQRDRKTAAMWYARAAAGGHLRAEFNLGLLYEAGSGVPQNHDLARYWYAQAAPRLSAARDRLGSLGATVAAGRGRAAPEPQAGSKIGPPDAHYADIVWTASPGPEGSGFILEVARETPDGRERVQTVRTEASASRIGLPDDATPFVWRVGRVVGQETPFAYSDWQTLDDAVPDEGDPQDGTTVAGQIVIYVNPGDLPALAFSTELAASFGRAGLGVSVRQAERPAASTSVAYRYEGDAELASSVAAFLPVLNGVDAVARPDLDSARGEVSIWLVGGPTSVRAKG